MAVRREKVVLELVDQFTPGMARAAVATRMTARELNSLSGEEIAASRSSKAFVRDLDNVSRAANGADSSINQLTGRIGLAVDALLTIGPAAIPIAAVAVPALTALASSLGFVVLGAGSAAIAFGGVGDALETLNKAHLDPTKDNLADAEEALKRLSPAAREFVEQLDSMRGLGKELRDAGAEELFPGLVEALDVLETRAPEVERIIRALNGTLGDIAAEGAASLASGRWGDFFHMLETEGPRTLDATADAIGNVVHGLSEIMEAFIPLNRDGLGWVVDMTEGFDDWATGLKKTEGFKEFTDYIRENGPQVADTLGALATAVVDIVTAAAPLGGPALSAIEAFAEAVSAVADSELATPLLAAVAAMRTINRLAPVTAGSLALMGGGGKAAAGAAAAGAAAAGGKGGKGASKTRGRGMGAGAGFAALIGADLLIDRLGWEEADKKYVDRSEAFAKKWGKSWADAAEEARVKLSDVLDVSTGTGPFGLKANDKGLTDELLTRPVERQIALQKKLREEYGLGYKALENQGILQEGFTEQFRRQREAVSPLVRDIERLGNMKAEPKIDLDDKDAKRKQRDNDDWITAWGRRQGRAKAEVEAQQAFTQFRLLGLEMNNLDGRVATTYVNTVRTVTGPQGAAVFGQKADGGTIPGQRYPYGDKHLYLLAPGEEVISNRNGQADRHRSLLKAINGGLADGGTSGKPGKRKSSAGFFVADDTASLEAAIVRLTSVAEDQTRAVDASTERVGEWANRMSDVSSATINRFNTGLFEETSGSIWSAGAGGGPLANIFRDIAGLEERQSIQQQFAGLGLTGDALAALLSEGSNADLQGILQGGDAAQIAAAYNQRAALQGSVGGFGAQAAYGAQNAAALKEQQKATAILASTEQRQAQAEQRLANMEALLQKMDSNWPDRVGQKVGAAVSGPAMRASQSNANGSPVKPS